MKNIIYIIDDEADILFSLSYWFTKTGYDVETFLNSKDLLDTLADKKPDLVLLDVNLNGEDGREICRHIKKAYNLSIPVILFSANPANGENFKQCEAVDFINKPFSLVEMSKIIAHHLEHKAS